MPSAHTPCWPEARQMTHTGHLRRRNWRHDDNQNRAYPSRQTVQPDGSTSHFRRAPVGSPSIVAYNLAGLNFSFELAEYPGAYAMQAIVDEWKAGGAVKDQLGGTA